MDVVVLTRNSSAWLRQCLGAITDGINVDRLIVVDGGSADSTVDIAHEHTRHIYYDDGRGIAYARMLALTKVRTSLFAFVDSDVVIPDRWEERMVYFLQEDVGAVESFVLGIPRTQREEMLEKLRIAWYHRTFNGRNKVSLAGKYARGFTGATILRTDLLSDLRMPVIPCHEDWVITQHILSQRFRWLMAYVPVRHFYHKREPGYITYATIRKLGYMPPTQFLEQSMKRVLGGVKYMLALKDPRILLTRLNESRVRLDGYFHWDRHLYEEYPV